MPFSCTIIRKSKLTGERENNSEALKRYIQNLPWLHKNGDGLKRRLNQFSVLRISYKLLLTNKNLQVMMILMIILPVQQIHQINTRQDLDL